MKVKAIATTLTLILPFLSMLELCAKNESTPFSLEVASGAVRDFRFASSDLRPLLLTAKRYDLEGIEQYIYKIAENRLEAAEELSTEELGVFFSLYEESSDVRFRRALRKKWNKIADEYSFDSYAFRAEYARRYGPKEQRDSIYSEVANAFASVEGKMAPLCLTSLLTALDNVPEKTAQHIQLRSILVKSLDLEDAEEDWNYIYALLKSLRMGYLDESQGARAFVLYEKELSRLGQSYNSLSDEELLAFIAASLEYEAWHNIDRVGPAENELEPAFEGAEGGGKFTRGGRGGKEYIVTTLEDNSKEGSLRYALEAEGPRIVKFAVSGDIYLKKAIKIRNPHITILGQTAPGEGICIRNYGLSIEADEVIMRYMRIRPGSDSGKEGDALEVRHSDHVIIDHCSFSWATDENLSFYACSNSTLQWCIISESLNSSVHSKGEHGYGGIWGGRNISFHHNLLVSNNSRNPRFDHPAIYDGEDLLLRRGSVDFCNNVIFNWGMKAIYGGERGWFNVRDNYFKAGPASRQLKGEYLEIYSSKSTSLTEGRFYIHGNIYDCSALEQKGNYQAKFPDEDKIEAKAAEYERISKKEPFVMKEPLRKESASQAYQKVLATAGASLKRDDVDERIVRETESGEPGFRGSVTGIPGIIDSENDLKN